MKKLSSFSFRDIVELSLIPNQNTANGVPIFFHKEGIRLTAFWSTLTFLLLIIGSASLSAQSSHCVPGSVQNGNGDPWSEECYLDDNCDIHGNPCTANDVQFLGAFIADSMGGPIPTCKIGDMDTFHLWGVFHNNTSTDRHAVRTVSEYYKNSVFIQDINSCSFNVLPPDTDRAVLLDDILFTCGDLIQMQNTWIAWRTAHAQCSDPSGADYISLCGEYSPSQCSQYFDILQFLVPNFKYSCGEASTSTTEVCFTDLSSGGTSPYTYLWDFGDGGSSTEQNPCHTYAGTSGAFTVLLTVTDSSGVMASAFLVIDLAALNCCNLTITCPPLNGGIFNCIEDIPAPDPGLITIVDSCGTVTITFSDQITGTGCGIDTMIVTRSYFITDGTSLDTCIQIFKAVDDIPPVVTCPDPVTLSCVDNIPDPDITLVTYTENCGGISTVSFVSDVISSQTCTNQLTIHRTYMVTDACNNTATCIQVIDIFDNTPPSLTCPADLTVSCTGNVPAANTGSVTTSDNCGGTVTVTVAADIISNQTCTSRYTITRTYTAADICGNTATCSQIITVFDGTPPSISCPVNVTVSCAADVPEPDTTSTIASDNCGGTVIVAWISDVTTNQDCANQYTITRTYMATDVCGNTATCIQIITVNDGIPPAMTCPDGITVSCATDVPAPNTALVSASDNCAGNVSVTVASDIITNQVCANQYTITRVYTATDVCGNATTCAQIITVLDNTPPSISCPGNITVSCATDVPEPDTASIIATDNCGGNITVTVANDVISNQDCPNQYTITRVYLAADECGNTATCAQIITVFDATVPTLTCLPDITVSCAGDVPAPNTTAITASDNCNGAVTVTFVDDVISDQTCANRYTITRTYRATDACGNTATCAQIITVFDATAPELTCLPDITVSCAGDVPAPNTTAITASDNCNGTVTVTFVNDVISDQTCANRYTITRTYRATDVCGNSATCAQIITVFDATVPTLTCLPDITVSCASDVPAPNTTTITASDNCNGTVSVTFVDDVISDQTCANRYTITRTYRATDVCGNSATCAQIITVFDATVPTLTCLPDITVSCAADVPAPNTTAITASDNCNGTVTVTFVDDVISDQTCANQYTITRTYRATDVCGNSATCAQTITVFDATVPTLTCLPDITVSCAGDVPAPNTTAITASDNCNGTVTVTFVDDVISDQTCANQYTITRTYRATDVCGNSATCTQIITVFDATVPTLTCLPDITVSCAGDVPAPNTTAITASDNCNGTVTVTFVDDVISDQTCANQYTITRTYRATDVCGNSATCAQIITVFDATVPTLTCLPDITVSCAGDVPAPNTTAITSSDNCNGTVTVTFVNDIISDQTCANRYTITRTYRATDVCGNSATCAQIITVFDATVPTLTCLPDITVSCASDVPAPNTTAITASDNCSGTVTVTVAPDVISNQTCANRYTVTRVYTATDVCGNSATCAQIITVFDATPPTITCPVNLTVSCAENVPAANTTSILTGDNCAGLVTVTVAPDVISSQTCTNRYTITRVYTATDVCGNTATCAQIITVFDATVPTLTCLPDITVSCAGDVPAPNTTAITASDNCNGTVTVTFVNDVISNQTCANRYTITRTYRATDVCGNSATCAQIITVFDATVPTLTCLPDITVSCAGDVPTPNTTTITASDNCNGTVTVTFVDDVISDQTCANRYTITRTYRATDVCGNSATCAQIITVFDATVPTLTCLPDITVSCASDVPAPNTTTITASDNCSGTVTVTVAPDVISNQTCANRYTVTRVYTATDVCGNSATCAQIITVFDATPPTITCPVNLTVSCAENVPAANTTSVLTGDNCAGLVTVTVAPDVISSQTCTNRYTITRVYTATDVCGNTATCAQIITVFDATVPTLTCLPDITVSCAADVPAPNTTAITASDNCNGTVTVTFVDDVISDQTCTNRYTITRTYRATDVCGNSATCAQIITVFDATVPTLTCLPDITVSCAGDVPAPNAAAITASDNCNGTVTVTVAPDVISNQTCANRYTVTRVYTATDVCGNSATCAQIITVFDATAPTLTCLADITVSCAADVPLPNTAAITTSDNCNGTVTVTVAPDVISNQTCANRYTVTRVYTATDVCGNSATCAQIITVFDATAPTLTCLADITVSCAADVPLPNIAAITTSDNCNGAVTVTVAPDVISNQTCANRYTVTRVYTATDVCGNSATCAQIITVFDATVPTLTCLPNITVSCASEVPAPNIAAITTSDNCNGAVTVTVAPDVISNQTCANRYIVTRVYTATDVCGNTATCAQIITVFDAIPPMITCPSNITVSCAGDVPVPNTSTVLAGDNCNGTVTITHVSDIISNQTCPNRYTLTRTYRATDVCGNSATCLQIITVFDNTAPSITAPADVSVECANEVPPVNTGSVLAADNCGGVITITHLGDIISNQNCVNQFVLTRTYMATDACGNTQIDVQIITVGDTEPPVITFTDPLIDGVPNGATVIVQCFGQDPGWDLPQLDVNSVDATDNCGVESLEYAAQLVQLGDCRIDGYINIYRLTWTATDSCDNASSAFVFLKLVDTIPPVIHGVPENITVSADRVPDPPTVWATDECLCSCIVLTEEEALEPGCVHGQVMRRIWTATDDCGNVSTKEQMITIIDIAGPEMIFIEPEMAGIDDGTIMEFTCNEGGIPSYFDQLNEQSVSVTDMSGPVRIMFEVKVIESINCEMSGYIEQRTYQWIAIDQCNNETKMTIMARLVDHEAPVLTGVPDMVCIGDPSLEFIEATDNCGLPFIRYWDVSIPNPCNEGQAIRRTYEAFDACGNMTRDTAILIPDDLIPPVIEFINPALNEITTGEIMTLSCSASDGQYTGYGIDDVIVNDGCAFGVNVTYSETLLETSDCIATGIIAVIEMVWTATDVCGNTASLSVRAHIVDQTSPVLVNFVPDITIGCNEALPEIYAEDNCNEVQVVINETIIPGSCEFEYDVLRTITATDPCGNSITKSQTVHVGNGLGPVIEGVITELCDDLSMPQVTAYDECAAVFVPVHMTQDTLDIPCRDGYVVERTWSATDLCGNTSEIKQHIVIGDKTPPEISVPSYSIIRKFLDNQGEHLVYLSQADIIRLLDALNESSVHATDDCDMQIIPAFNVTTVYAPDCREYGYNEHRTYTWTATDICGNAAILSFSLHVMDDIPPVFVDVPADTTIICAPVPPATEMIVKDAAQPIIIVFTESMEAGGGPGVYIIARRWIATDACGNATKYIQHITWIPDTYLECNIITPKDVECNTHGVLIESELTGGIGPFSYLWEVIGDECFIQSGQHTPSITIYVGWREVKIKLTVTDAYGCYTTCTTTLGCNNGFDSFNTGDSPGTFTDEENDPVYIPTDAQDGLKGDNLKQVNFWPNPAKDEVYMSFESAIERPVRLTLINLQGEVIHEGIVPASKGFNLHKIDVKELNAGGCLFKIGTGTEEHTRIIMIMRNE